MTKDILRYDKMVEAALRGVVREALSQAAQQGLPGNHHFYITFGTGDPGVAIPDFLCAKYPGEMTIVIEHQFWDLTVEDAAFSVTLSFGNRPERITIPFAAITAFADPSVKFGLQFQDQAAGDAAPAEGSGKPAAAASSSVVPAKGRAGPKLVEPPGKGGDDKKPADIVPLDAFRKK